MQVTHISLNNFRCFDNLTLTFEQPIVLIEGINGSGKTSLLEAFHYLCYLRSFRTYSPYELVRFNQDHFFIKVVYTDEENEHQVQVGFKERKKLVKIDNSPVSSYKSLLNYYRVITITEDDLSLIKGSPEIRRSFLDQALILMDPSYIEHIRVLRSILANRNSLLKKGNCNKETYELWTEQLKDITQIIQEKRKFYLNQLAETVNQFLKEFFDTITISFAYRERKKDISQLMSQEQMLGRSLFGAHLDDFTIHFRNKKSKSFASRGQQKLTMLLLKSAQLKLLTDSKGPTLFLIDDFITDFDTSSMARLLELLSSLKCQKIFTYPQQNDILKRSLPSQSVQVVKLTI